MRLARFQRPELTNWCSTFDQLWNLRDEINRFFEPFNGNRFSLDPFNSWAPAIDVYEDNDNVFVRAELPGMRKEDIEISLHENTLTVAGERKNEKHKDSQTAREERFFGRFQRSFTLPKPVDTDSVKAAYKDGILTVTLPKAPEAKPKQIKVEN